jgi:tetratricopeptide (TPR) repeat protein
MKPFLILFVIAIGMAVCADSIGQETIGSQRQAASAAGAEDRGLSFAKTGDRCRNSGNIDSAIIYYNLALGIDTNVFGKRHPSVARDFNNLGLIWSEKGEYDTAIGFYSNALQIDSTIHGKMHHKVANLYNNLGSSWSAKGEYDKAIMYFGLAIEIDTVVLGKNHRNVAVCYNNLGLAWEIKGDKQKSDVKTYRANLEQAKMKKREKCR